MIKNIIQILSPFEGVTNELSSEKYVSASKVIPLARGLQKVTQSLTAHSTGIGLELCHKLTSQMASRFISIEDRSVLAIATILDPRFKKIPFSSDSTVQRMSRQIISDAAAMIEPPLGETEEQQQMELPTPDDPRCNPVWEVFDQQVASRASTQARLPSSRVT